MADDDKITGGVGKRPADTPSGDPSTPGPVTQEPVLKAYLTADFSDEFGPKGRFIDLTEAQFAAAPAGMLLIPTPEQLARRRG